MSPTQEGSSIKIEKSSLVVGHRGQQMPRHNKRIPRAHTVRNTFAEGLSVAKNRNTVSRRREAPPSRKELAESRVQSPQTLLDHGQNDPFSALPTDLSRDFLAKQCYNTHYWLKRIVGVGNQGDQISQTFANTIMSWAVADAGMLYAVLSAGMIHSRTVNGTAETAIERHLGNKGVQLVNERLNDPTRALTESTLWTLVSLAFFESVEEPRVREAPQQSLLKELQNLHIHGRLKPREVYLQSLGFLMAKIGLQNLRAPGLAATCSYIVLFKAVREGKPPALPFVSYTNIYLNENNRLVLGNHGRERARPTLGRLGTSFAKVWTTGQDQPIADLLVAIRHMCDFTMILESHVQGAVSARSSPVMLDQRNFTQHALSSLPSSREFEKATGNLCDELYEPCRLACMVFGLLIIFPFPPAMGVFDRLATGVKRNVVHLKLTKESEPARNELKLWVLVMGSLASIGTSENDWFITEIVLMLSQIGITDRSSLISLLQGFLWHPSTSARDCARLWRDVQEKRKHVKEDKHGEV